MSPAVCPGKCDGRASWLFRIAGNRGRAPSFRASFAISAFHNHTILTQRVRWGLSIAPDNAPTGKEDKTFSRRRIERVDAPSGPVYTQLQEWFSGLAIPVG